MSNLRELRERTGVSAAELARQAGVAPNTVLNAERGKTIDVSTRRRIAGALTTLLQREVYSRVSDARADVTRAEVELEGARQRLEQANAQHEADAEQLRADIAELWDEATDEAEDAAPVACASS